MIILCDHDVVLGASTMATPSGDIPAAGTEAGFSTISQLAHKIVVCASERGEFLTRNFKRFVACLRHFRECPSQSPLSVEFQ